MHMLEAIIIRLTLKYPGSELVRKRERSRRRQTRRHPAVNVIDLRNRNRLFYAY